jgi:hypothetical protein
MKSCKSQAQPFRDIPNTKMQTVAMIRCRGLKLGISLALGGWCFVLGCAFSASAQYSIDWHTIDGGGGTSTGGVYQVSGTIGQPDAGGPMTNGQYSVTGGFWALPQAVQVSGAPTLKITAAAPGFATLSWTPATPGFVLQESSDVASGWTNSPSGAANPTSVPASGLLKFYRLNKP